MKSREMQENETTSSESLFVDYNTSHRTEVDVGVGGTVCPDFISLLVRPVPYEYKLKRCKTRRQGHEGVVFEVDDSHRFRNSVTFAKSSTSTIQSLSSSKSSTMREYAKARALEAEIKAQYQKNVQNNKKVSGIYPIDVVDWEREVEMFTGSVLAIEGDNTRKVANEIFTEPVLDNIPADEPGWEEAIENTSIEQVQGAPVPSSDILTGSVLVKEYVNNLLSGDWEENVFFDEDAVVRNHLTLYIDDPNLIFERVEEKKRGKNKKKSVMERLPQNKYNISNDKYYTSEGKKVSLGTFGVQHSTTALRLDERFYRTNLSKDELKNFHRPILRMPDGEYSMKCAGAKRRNDTMKKGWELSLDDQIMFHVVEYSEIEPPFIVNPGMVSLFNKYYRTSDAGDEQCPPGCITLEQGEEAPFLGYGEVSPGTSLQAIANNLFIAPVVQHSTTGTYLCIVHEGSLVVRPFNEVLLVGQELPKEEVFAPHSRRLNQFCKDRLKVAAHRAFAKGRHLLMSDLDDMFPYFSEGSKRKWLKEYADCIKKGRDNVWVLRDPHPIICDEDLRKLVTPEDICQYESMLACEMRMQELGVRFTEDTEEDSLYFIPTWVLTRNFVNAVNGRGLLQLDAYRGRGRSEGRGLDGSILLGEEAESVFYSFRKVRFRKGNETENRKILAEHQASYKERVDHIWARQMEFLMSTKAPEYQPRNNVEERKRDGNETGVKESEQLGLLIIKRRYLENGIIVQRVEKIQDKRLIKAYLKAKKRIAPEKKTGLTCSNCGQTGHMKTNKTCPNYVSATKTTKKKQEIEKRRARILLQDMMNRLLTRFMNIPFSNAFHRPVQEIMLKKGSGTGMRQV
ncbi:transcription initiation factor TFIID subunit 1 [Pancytospora epiphaga]|nr:transcription initiation factor TFIID subunit 1 [Pancytospora epiphaga]